MTKTLQCQNDPSLAKIQLRAEVSHSLRTSGGDAFVMLNDPVHSQFYRLGIEEWQIARLFDGTRTVRQVIAAMRELNGLETKTPEETIRLAHWLTQNRLADTVEGSLQGEASGAGDDTGRNWSAQLNEASRWHAWNPLFVKVSLPDPQPVLKLAFPLMSWLFTPLGQLVVLMVCIAGAIAVGSDWERFTSSFASFFAPTQWFYLMAIWLVMKLLHELGHAVCCQRLGGRVTRCGLMFIVFSPIAWVDVTSAWAFRSKWQRMAVSAAGMYVELFVAGIAALVWANTDSPWIGTLSRNVVVSATITSIVFNLNILMRFDGYFILTDLIEIQNLYASGQQYLQYVQRRYVLGLPASLPKATGWKQQFIRVYSVAAMVWRLVFYVGIVIVATKMFHGAGLVLGVFSGLLWFGLPLLRLCLTACIGNGSDQPRRARFAAVVSGFAILLAATMYSPWPGSSRVHGFVEYAPLEVLRADHGGFVREILTRSGDRVREGQVLVRLENRELLRELADLELQIKIKEIEQRVMHREDDLARYEAIAEKIRSLQEQHAQLNEQVTAMTVTALCDGEVIAQDLDSLLGRYISAGEEILAVGAAGKKEIRVCIPQRDVETFRSAQDETVRLRIEGRHLENDAGTFARVSPRATRRVLHPALAATVGGPLAVQAASGMEKEEHVLVESSFEGIVELPAELSGTLRSGEVCTVSLGPGRQRVFEKLLSLGRKYIAYKS